jgi:hypothetical protein
MYTTQHMRSFKCVTWCNNETTLPQKKRCQERQGKTTLYPNNPKTHPKTHHHINLRATTHAYPSAGGSAGLLPEPEAAILNCSYRCFKNLQQVCDLRKNKLNNKPTSKRNPSETSEISPNKKCMMYAQLQVGFTNLQKFM